MAADAPSGLTAVAGDTQVTLAWDEPTVDEDDPITGYQLFYHAQRAKLVPISDDDGRDFAYSVAVDGDIAVVGLRGDADSSGDSGAAYVFSRSASGWTQTYRLSTAGPVLDDGFGTSVAFDGETIVVGAPLDQRDDGNGTDILLGAAYVFTKPASGWDNPSGTETIDLTETAKLTASDGAGDVTEGDEFGTFVAVAGDVVVVGAREHDKATGKVYLYSKPQTGWASTNAETAQLTSSDGDEGDYFGETVAIEGDTIVVGADGDGSDTGSAYVFVKPVSGWGTGSQTAKLTASDGAQDDELGGSVALDGEIIVVGARGDESDTGSAYVFIKPGAGWDDGNEAAKLTASASNGAQDDELGGSVAIDGDIIVVGARGDDRNTGSAYVFVKPGDGWGDGNEAAKLTASDGALNDQFGWSVAVNGDTVVVGADNEEAAYVFDIKGWDDFGGAETTSRTITGLSNGVEYSFALRAVSDSGPGPASTLDVDMIPAAPTNLASTPSDGEVALAWDDPGNDTINKYQYSTDSGDTWTDIPGSGATTTGYTITGLSNGTTYTFELRAVNDSGNGAAATATAVMMPVAPANFVAAPGNARVDLSWEDPGNATIGKYQVLQLELAKLSGFDGQSDDGIGSGVAVDNDTAVIGVPGANGASGVAFVFTRVSGAWTKQAKLTASDRQGSDVFGISVAVSGNTAVVGASGDDDNGSRSGSVYVFTKPSGGWSAWDTLPQTGEEEEDEDKDGLTVKLTASDGAEDDFFGRSVAVDRDTVVVGAHQDDDNGTDSGSAYVFTKPSDGWNDDEYDGNETAKLTASDSDSEGNLLGFSVAVDGDTVVVGSPGANDAKGGAYVFTKPSDGWNDGDYNGNEIVQLTASNGENGDVLGDSIAVDADTVVVGADFDDDNGSNSGSAYVFTKPSAGWNDDDYNGNETAKLLASDGAVDDFFGKSVAVDGDVILIGAPTDWTRKNDLGSVYLFTRNSGTWSETTKLNAPDGVTRDVFGQSVALDGNAGMLGALNASSDGVQYTGGTTDSTSRTGPTSPVAAPQPRPTGCPA